VFCHIPADTWLKVPLVHYIAYKTECYNVSIKTTRKWLLRYKSNYFHAMNQTSRYISVHFGLFCRYSLKMY